MPLTTPTLTVIAAACLSLTGCGSNATHPDQRNVPGPTIQATQVPTGSVAATASSTAPTTATPAARPATIAPDPSLRTPVIPSTATATAIASAVSVAKAWAITANSSSYRDRTPGEWVARARPFTAGAEARAETHERTGGGGSTWARIQNRKCVTSLIGLTAATPSDAPSGPTTHVVYVSATVALHCADNTVQLTPYAVQLIVHRIAGRWLVTDSTY